MKSNNKPGKPVQLTPSLLRSLIEAEVKGFGDMEDVEDRASDSEETDADEFADSVERPVDWKKVNKIKESDSLDEHISYMKALKLEEGRLTKRLERVRVALKQHATKLVIAKVV